MYFVAEISIHVYFQNGGQLLNFLLNFLNIVHFLRITAKGPIFLALPQHVVVTLP
jgi:hypothetical protein